MSVDLLKLIKGFFSGKKYNEELLSNYNYNYTSGNSHPKSFNPKSQKEQMEYVNRRTRELIEAQRENAQREKEKSINKLVIKKEDNTMTTNINYNFYNGMMVGVIFGFGISKYFFRFIWK